MRRTSLLPFFLTLAAICFCYGAPTMAEEGVKTLFNGKDLSGWKGNVDFWSVEDEAITGTTSAEKPLEYNTFLVWQDGVVSDFVLELDYRLTAGDEQNPGGNSGIQYRSKLLDDEKYIVGGYQADIDLSLTYSGINYEERGRGILAQRGEQVTIAQNGKKAIEKIGDAAELGKIIKGGEWNSYRIVANGSRVSHFINETLMSEVIDQEEAKSAAEGILAFQIHTGPPMKIQFKNIRLTTR